MSLPSEPFEIDGIIFEVQRVGGISRLWNTLIEYISLDCANVVLYANPKKLKQEIGTNRCTIRSCNSSYRFLTKWIVFVPRNKVLFSTYFQINIGPGKLVTVCHDLMVERERTFKSFFKKAFFSLVYLRSTKVVCISPLTFDSFRSHYASLKDKTVLIPNPIAGIFAAIEPSPTKVSNDDFISLLYIGNRKGNKNFVHSEKLLSLFVDVKLYVIGKSFTEEEQLRYKAFIDSGRMENLGEVDDGSYIELLKKANFLYMPSLDEGFGLPFIESLCAGTPVICVRADLFKWISRSGFIVFDEFVLAGGTFRYAAESIISSEMLEISHSIKNRFSPDRIARQYLNLGRSIH